MGAPGQLIETAHARFRDPAARAQERPLQIQEPDADRLQAELDRLALRATPGPRQLQRPDVPEVDLRRAQNQLGKASARPCP